MPKRAAVANLLRRYSGKIKIKHAGFYPYRDEEGREWNGAYLNLNMPRRLLAEVSQLAGQNSDEPGPDVFWKALREQLCKTKRPADLKEVLDSIGETARLDYAKLSNQTFGLTVRETES